MTVSKGFVGLFKKPLGEGLIRACVESWFERFDKVEQVCPNQGAGAVTMNLENSGDVFMEENQQYRVLLGDDFTWVYITKDRYVIETTGFPDDDHTLCLDVLVELPDIVEIIDQKNDRRLDQLEAEGLM